jgi:hypothetical protein
MKEGISPFEFLAYLLPGWLLFMAVMLAPPPIVFAAPALLEKEAVAALTWLFAAYVSGHLCGLISPWLHSKLLRQKNYIVEIWDDPVLKAVSTENRCIAFSIFLPYFPQLLYNLDRISSNPAYATGLFNLVQEYNRQQGIHEHEEAVYGEVKFLKNLSAAALLGLIYVAFLIVWRAALKGCAHVLDDPWGIATVLVLFVAILLLTYYRIPQRSRLHVLLVYRAFLVCRLRLTEENNGNGRTH